MLGLLRVMPELARAMSCPGLKGARSRGSRQIQTEDKNRTHIGLIHALNVLFPGTGPGGYFGNGSTISRFDDDSKGLA